MKQWSGKIWRWKLQALRQKSYPLHQAWISVVVGLLGKEALLSITAYALPPHTLARSVAGSTAPQASSGPRVSNPPPARAQKLKLRRVLMGLRRIMQSMLSNDKNDTWIGYHIYMCVLSVVLFSTLLWSIYGFCELSVVWMRWARKKDSWKVAFLAMYMWVHVYDSGSHFNTVFLKFRANSWSVSHKWSLSHRKEWLQHPTNDPIQKLACVMFLLCLCFWSCQCSAFVLVWLIYS